VRSDLLEFPTGSLSVIRAFQANQPQRGFILCGQKF